MQILAVLFLKIKSHARSNFFFEVTAVTSGSLELGSAVLVFRKTSPGRV